MAPTARMAQMVPEVLEVEVVVEGDVEEEVEALEVLEEVVVAEEVDLVAEVAGEDVAVAAWIFLRPGKMKVFALMQQQRVW